MPNEEKKLTAQEQAEKLKQAEKTTGRSGAVPEMPKNMLLDASDVQAKDADHHYRYINVKSADNAMLRKRQGYEIVPEGEGGHRLGDELALARTSQDNYRARQAHFEKVGKERLQAHKTEVQRVVEGVVRELRDKHGISVNEKRLFVNEE